MQSGVVGNGTRVNSFSSGSSSVMSVSGSKEGYFEEKPKINVAKEGVIDEVMDKERPSRSTISVPSLISVTAATAEATSSMNSVEGGYRVGGAGEVISEPVLRVNQSIMAPSVATVPVLQSQAGFWQLGTSFGNGGSDLTPIIPGLNSSYSLPVGSPYRLHCFPYNNMCFSSAAAHNLKRKVEVSGSSCNPSHVESFISHVPSSFCHDSVFTPVQAVYQNRLFPASGSQICNPSGGGTSAAMHKRKVVRLRCSSSLNVAAVSDATKNDNSESSDKLRLHAFRERYSLGATPSGRESFAPTCSVSQPGYLPSACVYKPDDDKVIEGKGWTVLVQKELRNSDVGNLGRIVLPKKDAEANFPTLVAKEGLILQMEDMTYSVNWKFKYRYWPNNRSRMYVMENTGDFVRMHNLQTGDFFVVYKEEISGKYIARGKKAMKSLYAGDLMELRDHRRAEDKDTRSNSQVGLAHGTSSVPTESYEGTRDETFMANESFDFERYTDGPSGSAFTSLPDGDRNEIP